MLTMMHLGEIGSGTQATMLGMMMLTMMHLGEIAFGTQETMLEMMMMMHCGGIVSGTEEAMMLKRRQRQMDMVVGDDKAMMQLQRQRQMQKLGQSENLDAADKMLMIRMHRQRSLVWNL